MGIWDEAYSVMHQPSPAGWSAAELATLAAIAETLMRGGSNRRARLAAEAYCACLDPSQVRQLRLGLRLFESRAANLVLAGRPVRFGDLSPGNRERYLLGWAGSHLGLRRSAFQALKRLLSFLAGADPGDGGVMNPLWEAAGYRPPLEPITPEPTPIRPLTLPARGGAADDVVELDADVVVVGSGAGGGVMAAELARAGRSVVVLEAGAFVPEPEMPTNELDAFDRLYLNRGLVASWDGAVVILAGGTVGGGTTVNWMTSIAPPEPRRAHWAHVHGVDGFDGPEVDSDLAILGGELGLSGPPSIPPKDEVILRGTAALGLEGGETRRNGVGCGDCGSCGFGCRRGAKQSGLRVHLAEAWRHGARIIPDAEVRRVLVEHGRAAGVEAVVAPRAGGAGAPATAPRRLVVRAVQVVVAAGALRTPAVLTRSGLDHPSIGRYLRLHPVSVLGARLAEPVEMWRGTTQAARSLAFLGGDDGLGGFVVESAPGHLGLAMLAFPWEGTDAYAELVGRLRHFAPLLAITAERGHGRVRLTRSGHVRIDYRVGDGDAAVLRRGLIECARIGRAAGARELVALGTPAAWHNRDGFDLGREEAAFARYLERLERFDFAPNRGTVFSAHQMGTARMGGDPRDHACDPRGRVRAGTSGRLVGGLYVADTSLFPTAVGVNPMITAMLLARRVSRTVLAER